MVQKSCISSRFNSASLALCRRHPSRLNNLTLCVFACAHHQHTTGLMFIIWSTYWLWSVIDIHLRSRAAAVRGSLPSHTVRESSSAAVVVPCSLQLFSQQNSAFRTVCWQRPVISATAACLCTYHLRHQHLAACSPALSTITQHTNKHNTVAVVVPQQRQQQQEGKPVLQQLQAEQRQQQQPRQHREGGAF